MKQVNDGWHESKSLNCDFNVENGVIVAATDLSHTQSKHAYGRDGYRVDGVKYENRYNYRWC